MCLAILAQPPGSFTYSRRRDVTECVIFRLALAGGAEPFDGLGRIVGAVDG